MKTRNILTPIDFSDNSGKAFEVACDLASQLHARLFVLHVQDETALRTTIKEGLLTPASKDDDLQPTLEIINRLRFSEMTAGQNHRNLDIEYIFRHGCPKREIVFCAREIEAQFIVMGTHGMTAMDTIVSALLGSVSEHVVRKSPCPVVLVRSSQGSESEQTA